MKLVGIYCYRDKKDNSVVYIGLDNNIDKNKRHKDHLQPSNYNSQPFNRILQKNSDRYMYEVLKKFDAKKYNNKLLYVLEILYIRRYQPKFNYTVGGDGLTGFKHSEKTKQKLREINTGKHHSEETKIKMSESHKGKRKGFTHSEESKKKMSESTKGENHPNYGKHLSEKTKRKISEANKNKYATLIKRGFYNGKQIYAISKDRKVIKSSIYPSKLLKWFAKEFPKGILQIKISDDW